MGLYLESPLARLSSPGGYFLIVILCCPEVVAVVYNAVQLIQE